MARPEPSQLGALVPVSECDTQVGGDTAPGWGGRPTGPSESRTPHAPAPGVGGCSLSGRERVRGPLAWTVGCTGVCERVGRGCVCRVCQCAQACT